MMKKVYTLFMSLIFTLTYSQENSFVDLRDGKSYNAIKINDNVWMAENLNTEKFINGDDIFQINSLKEWEYVKRYKIPAWCYYNFDSSNEKYGKLYNWYAVISNKGLAPKGWHIPRPHEFDDLIKITSKKLKTIPIIETKVSYEEYGGYYRTNYIPCSNCKNWNDSYRKQVPCHKCKNERYFKKRGKWFPKTKEKKEEKIQVGGWNGTNESGFSAENSGYFYHNDDSYYYSSFNNGEVYFWSNDKYYVLNINNTSVSKAIRDKESNDRIGYYPEKAFYSVRCIRGDRSSLEEQNLLKANDLFIKANEYLKNNNYENAIRDIERSIKLNTSIETPKGFIDAYYFEGAKFDNLDSLDFVKIKNNTNKISNNSNKISESERKAIAEKILNAPLSLINKEHEYDNYTKAKSAYNKAVFLAKKYNVGNEFLLKIYLKMGNFYFRNDKHSLAKSFYVNALEIEPKNKEAHVKKATLDFNNEKLSVPKTIESLNEALNVVTNNPDLFYYRGVLNLKDSSFSKSIDDFTVTLSLDPKYLEAYILRGKSYIDGYSNYEKALNDYSDILNIISNTNVLYENLRYNRAITFLKLRKPKKGLNELKFIDLNFTLNKDITPTDELFHPPDCRGCQLKNPREYAEYQLRDFRQEKNLKISYSAIGGLGLGFLILRLIENSTI